MASGRSASGSAALIAVGVVFRYGRGHQRSLARSYVDKEGACSPASRPDSPRSSLAPCRGSPWVPPTWHRVRFVWFNVVRLLLVFTLCRDLVVRSLFALTVYHGFLGGVRSLFALVRGDCLTSPLIRGDCQTDFQEVSLL